MRGWNKGLAVAGVAAMLVLTAGTVRAQAGGGGFGAGGFDMTQMRTMMMQRFQQQIEATDEEWRVIEPRFMKVLQLQMDAGQGLPGMLRGVARGGGGRGGAGGANVNQMIQQFFGQTEPSMVERRLDELQKAIDENASAERLKDKLEALRAAREKARADLVKAQASLVEVLSLRQEATLVQMGLLE
jgi:hypothetical protein